MLFILWRRSGQVVEGRGSGALPFQRAAPGPDPEGVLSHQSRRGCPTLSGRLANLCCVHQSCLFVDGQKLVSAALSHLPLEGSAAPAERLGKWPALSSVGRAAISRSHTGERRLP